MSRYLLLFSYFLAGAFAQNQNVQNLVTSELGIGILSFVSLVLVIIGATWLCFCYCLCDIALTARRHEKIEMELEEQLEMAARQRRAQTIDPRFHPGHHNSQQHRLIRQQHQIERAIAEDNQARLNTIVEETDMLDDHAPPRNQQQRILSTLHSIPTSSSTFPWLQGQSNFYYHEETSDSNDEITSGDSQSSIDSEDIVDIMTMPNIPRVEL